MLYRIDKLKIMAGNRTILVLENLIIVEGRLHILTGTNGSGKSTLLSLLAFLSPPSSGELLFSNDPVRWRRDILHRLRREVTLMHQTPYLFAGCVSDNVAFGLRLRGIRGREQRQRVEQVLEMTSLAGFGGRNASHLSGGEIRRVAMARALVLRPRVLLLDEPLANVDRETVALLEKLITNLPRQGTTVIMATHEADHVERLGGESIHLVDGRIGERSS